MKKGWKLLICGTNLIFLITKIFWVTIKQNEMQKSSLVSFQLQVAINNNTSNVNSNNAKSDPNDPNHYFRWDWFYIELSINGRAYNDDDFRINNKSSTIVPENSKNGSGSHKDVFATPCYSEAIILSLINTIESDNIQFTFGTYYDLNKYTIPNKIWYHTQLTNANNYNYSLVNQFDNTGDAGAKLVINANGSKGANSANWGIHPYKFNP